MAEIAANCRRIIPHKIVWLACVVWIRHYDLFADISAGNCYSKETYFIIASDLFLVSCLRNIL